MDKSCQPSRNSKVMNLPILTSFISGRSIDDSLSCVELIAPSTLQPYARLSESSEQNVQSAVQSAHNAFQSYRKTPLSTRAQWLNNAATEIEKNLPELIDMLIQDIGKPKKASTFEANRSAGFLRATASEALTLRGETIPVDSLPAGSGKLGFTKRYPYGVVAGITPFNAPINLLVQKVAPALVAGNAIVIKPHPSATRITLKIAEIFHQSGLPSGLFNVLTGDRFPAAKLVANPLVIAVSFTGGTLAGDALVRAAGAKKFLAELGSNAANIVLADADIEDAAKKIASAAFEASGQQCISAQRIIVEEKVYDEFLNYFIAATKVLKVGDPLDENTDIGPMVSLQTANRVMAIVADAKNRGLEVALDPIQKDCTVSPGIIIHPTSESSIWRDEVFGPLATVAKAKNSDEALKMANDSEFGLQGALFTRSLKEALRFSEDFEVGSLWVNEVSRFRLDMYPFGGSKRSGFGREGVRYAIEELSQTRFTGIRFDF